jgi:hypothetical protein
MDQLAIEDDVVSRQTTLLISPAFDTISLRILMGAPYMARITGSRKKFLRLGLFQIADDA